MIEFSSSLKSNEIHTGDSPFNEDPKKFFSGGHNFKGGTVGKFREIDNNRDIYCYANHGWSIWKENIRYQNPCDASIFSHARPNFRKKMKKNLIFRQKCDLSLGSSPPII